MACFGVAAVPIGSCVIGTVGIVSIWSLLVLVVSGDASSGCCTGLGRLDLSSSRYYTVEAVYLVFPCHPQLPAVSDNLFLQLLPNRILELLLLCRRLVTILVH